MKKLYQVQIARKLAVAMTAMSIAAVVGGIGAASAGASAKYPSIIQQDSPFAYWQLAERGGSVMAQDSSGYGRTGSYAACVNLGQSGPIRSYPATSALLGANQGCYMTWTRTPFSSTGSFTPWLYSGSYSVEAWVMPSLATKVYQTFFDSRAPDTVQMRCMFGRCSTVRFLGDYSVDFKLVGTASVHGQQLCADIGDGLQWLGNPCTSFTFAAGRWYYLALTVSASTSDAKLFVDGRLVGDFALANTVYGPLLYDTHHPIVLGGNPRYDSPTNPYPENFEGNIGQVAVYEYALSSSQVAAHYSAGERP